MSIHYVPRPKPGECGYSCIICGPGNCPVNADFGELGEDEFSELFKKIEAQNVEYLIEQMPDKEVRERMLEKIRKSKEGINAG